MENPHTILGLAVPTNEPEVAFRYLLASVQNLKEVAPISTFLFNFQKPWNSDLIEKAVKICESAGFEVRWAFNSYEIKSKGRVPIYKIRTDTCKLMPDAKFYLLMDDDFYYQPRSASCYKSAGEQHLDCISYMLDHPDCGMLLLKNKMRINLIPKYYIMPALHTDSVYMTDKGIIFRNFDPANGLILPNEAVSLVGSDEEKVACSWRLYHGFYPAVMNFTRTLHYENANKNAPDRVTAGELMYHWNTSDILEENANKFIKEHYYPGFKNRGWRVTRIIDPYTYFLAGGLDITEEEIRSELTEFVGIYDIADKVLNKILDYYSK